MGLGPIPVSKIDEYVGRLELDVDAADRLFNTLRLIDTDYLRMSSPGSKFTPKNYSPRGRIRELLFRLAKKEKEEVKPRVQPRIRKPDRAAERRPKDKRRG